jgi:hypothetical protein
VDREAFDRLSRLVAAAGSRRAALRLLLGGALVGVTAGAEGAAAKRGKRARRGKRGGLRAQQEAPLCPATCTQDCADKPIHGGVNLTKCDLSERDLDGANLGGSNLTRACFEDASLRDVRFRGANLSGACFCNADLRGADFRGTRITAAQLACAKPGCDTILPTGKPAIVCGANETCCDGICVNTATDPDNCGACGVSCGLCRRCENGQCATLPLLDFDCNGNRLVFDPSGFGECTATPGTGICDGTRCHCGPQGENGDEPNTCVCGPAARDFCEDKCCVIRETCFADGGFFSNKFDCVECAPGAP